MVNRIGSLVDTLYEWIKKRKREIVIYIIEFILFNWYRIRSLSIIDRWLENTNEHKIVKDENEHLRDRLFCHDVVSCMQEVSLLRH